LLTQLNTLLYESTDAAMYATMFYAVYDEASRVLTYSNAGHEAPVLLRTTSAGTECMRLDARTYPVGLLPTLPTLQTSVQLTPGDWLVIFTDGITEALNESGEEFGAARVMAAVSGASAQTAEEMRQAIIDELKGHSHVPQNDDITLITAHVQ
jgi:sigma-B regulation protein RsbU (phosphoserine phosphatase)